MADGTTVLRNAVYEAVVRDEMAPVYLALYSDASTELSPTGYAREEVSMGDPTDGLGTNDEDVEFDAFTGAGGPITHGALWDAASGGNRLTAIKAFTGPSLAWEDGVPVVIGAGNVTFQVL
jgi:hypothetical protein